MEDIRGTNAPDGNKKDKVEHLKNITTEWGGKIARGQLSHATAEYCLRSIVFQKLAYPLVATAMTKIQCGEILKPLHAARLPLAGFIRMYYKYH